MKIGKVVQLLHQLLHQLYRKYILILNTSAQFTDAYNIIFPQIHRCGTTSTILQQHRVKVLPSDKYDRVRIIVRRSNILKDTLHRLRNDLDISKYIRVTFVNEPAVDEGGPLREYFCLLLKAIATNITLFSGPESSRTPNHNVLEKRTFYYIMGLLLLFHGVQHHIFSLQL